MMISKKDWDLFFENKAVIDISELTNYQEFENEFPIVDGLTLNERFNNLFERLGEEKTGFLGFVEKYKKFVFLDIKPNYITAFNINALDSLIKREKKIIKPKETSIATFDI